MESARAYSKKDFISALNRHKEVKSILAKQLGYIIERMPAPAYILNTDNGEITQQKQELPPAAQKIISESEKMDREFEAYWGLVKQLNS